MRTAYAGLLLSLLCAASAFASDPKEQLEELRDAIEERRERIAAFERRERSVLETLEEIDRAAEQLSQQVARAAHRADFAKEEADKLARRQRELETRLAGTRQAMSTRAVALYKSGEFGPVRVLFSAESLQELLARSRALRFLLDHDRELIARHQQQVASLEQTRLDSAEATRERDRALAALRTRAQALSAERAAKANVLSSVRGDRERERLALGELEAAARALEEALENLRAEPRQPDWPEPGVAFSKLRGRLPAPVDGRVVRRFGRVVDSEFRTQTFRKGVDFEAPLGETVRAVAAGLVRFAGRFRGYGNLVILDHANEYFTVSAHLDEIAVQVGDPIQAGAPIGFVGESGSLAGPLLYFEIRHASEALDPGEWLAAGSAR